MSAIGRIFLVLNLILAAVFLGWASTSLATSAEYKQKFDDEARSHAEAKALMDTEKSTLQAEVTRLKSSNAEYLDQRDQYKQLADGYKQNLDEAGRENDQMRADLAKIQASLDGYNTTISSLNDQKDRAVQQAHDAENARNEAQGAKDVADKARRDAEEKLRTAQAQIADLEKSVTSAKKGLLAMETKLATVQAAYNIPIDAVAVQPLIDGSVLQIDYSMAPGLVAINRGSNDNVSPGMVFEIYSLGANGTYKGQARVENVHKDVSSAVLIRTVEGTTIGQGDRASTRL
jgi:hypothetical protein